MQFYASNEEISRNQSGIVSERDMEEEEHEVYGGEIPVEGEMEGDVDMSAGDDDAVKVAICSFSFWFSCFGENQKNYNCDRLCISGA